MILILDDTVCSPLDRIVRRPKPRAVQILIGGR
jgi:hypothetical protein